MSSYTMHMSLFLLINTIIVNIHAAFISSYEGTADYHDFIVGDMVLIKFRGGYYLKDDGDGSVSVSNYGDGNHIYDSNNYVWEVHQTYGTETWEYNFKNLQTGKWLKAGDDSCHSGTVDGGGSWAIFELCHCIHVFIYVRFVILNI